MKQSGVDVGRRQTQQHTGPRGAARVRAGEGSAPRRREAIPAVHEELVVGKREVDSGEVRIRKVARERRELVDLPLLREEVQIDRIPVNRPVPGPIPAREEEDGTVVISIVEEALEVQKSWVLREEVRIRRRQVQTRSPKTVSLRGEELIVERTGPGGRARAPGRTGQGSKDSAPTGPRGPRGPSRR